MRLLILQIVGQGLLVIACSSVKYIVFVHFLLHEFLEIGLQGVALKQ